MIKLNIRLFNKTWWVNQISEKLKNSIKKEFDSEPVYNEKYLRPKKNLIMEKSTQMFTITKFKKKALSGISLSVLLTDSIFRRVKNDYPQVLIE